MKKRKIQLLALILALAMALSGCGVVMTAAQLLLGNGRTAVTPFEDIVYTRPDLSLLNFTLNNVKNAAWYGDSLDQVMEAVYEYYDLYDMFYTNLNLAQIYYSMDMTDIYWSEEYAYCMENSATVNAGLEELYRILAQSPMRKQLETEAYFGADFFAAYEGDALLDETLVALMEQEALLQNRYYELTDQAREAEYYSEDYFTRYGTQMAELFVELIRLRQEIAAWTGYDNYQQFAYDYYYGREYSPEEAEEYLLQLADTLYEPYCYINQTDIWALGNTTCTEEETFAYVKEAANAMGGEIREGFRVLEKGGLYHISYGENKYPTSFETYLWNYSEPFVFLAPSMDPGDKLTFAHEFGHFLNDYLCYGSYAGTDVAEVHSQGFEYLSLCYGTAEEDLRRYKLANSLCAYMENGAYALFEHQVYSLTDSELTADNVQALYEEIGLRFGLDSWAWDSRDYVLIPHFFTNPLYVMGYVVSNDVAMQLYELELGEAGAGLSLYRQCLTRQDSSIITLAEACGFASPFDPQRLEALAECFREYE